MEWEFPVEIRRTDSSGEEVTLMVFSDIQVDGVLVEPLQCVSFQTM